MLLSKLIRLAAKTAAFASAVLISQLASAHDMDIATFQIRHLQGDVWVYEVMSPLYSLDQSMRASLADRPNDLASLEAGATKYKEQLVRHVKEGFQVEASRLGLFNRADQSVELSLGQGRIKLDNHMSILIFEIIGMPYSFDRLDFRLTNMSNNLAQNNIFRLIDGERSHRYMLNAQNDFAGVDLGFFNRD